MYLGLAVIKRINKMYKDTMKIVGPERLHDKVSTMLYKINPKLKLENYSIHNRI